MSILDQTSSTPITKHYLENNGWKLEVNWTKWESALRNIFLYIDDKLHFRCRIGYVRLEYHTKSPFSKHLFVEYIKRQAFFPENQEIINKVFDTLNEGVRAYAINSTEDLEQFIKILEHTLGQNYNIYFENHQLNE